MAKLSKSKRASLPGSVFAGPNRSYPVDTPGRARAAAGFAAMHHASPAIKAKIKAKAAKIGEQHGPVDDMPKRQHARHQSQVGTMRVMGGDCS